MGRTEFSLGWQGCSSGFPSGFALAALSALGKPRPSLLFYFDEPNMINKLKKINKLNMLNILNMLKMFNVLIMINRLGILSMLNIRNVLSMLNILCMLNMYFSPSRYCQLK